MQASTPSSMTPGSARKSGWSRSRTTKKSRLSTAECTSIVDGLKLIYFSKVCLICILTCLPFSHVHGSYCLNLQRYFTAL